MKQRRMKKKQNPLKKNYRQNALHYSPLFQKRMMSKDKYHILTLEEEKIYINCFRLLSVFFCLWSSFFRQHLFSLSLSLSHRLFAEGKRAELCESNDVIKGSLLVILFSRSFFFFHLKKKNQT